MVLVVVIGEGTFFTLILFWAVFALGLGTGVLTAGMLIVFSGEFCLIGSIAGDELFSFLDDTGVFLDDAGSLGDFFKLGKLWAAHSIANKYQ